MSSLFLCAAQQLRSQCDPPVPGPRKDPYVPCIDGRINDVFSMSIIVKIALENLVKKNRLLIIWPSFSWELFLLFSCLDFPPPHVRSDNHVFLKHTAAAFLMIILKLNGRCMSFPGDASGKEPACQCRSQRHRFGPWVGKIPWRRAQQPTPVFLPAEFHGQRNLGYSPYSCKGT